MIWIVQGLLTGQERYRIPFCFATSLVSSFALAEILLLSEAAAAAVGLHRDIALIFGLLLVLPLIVLSMLAFALLLDAIWSILGVYGFLGWKPWAIKEAMLDLTNRNS